jgi:hypothetical protein
MSSSQLKRAERAMQSIRDQAELPPETADALQELVELSALQSKGKPHPTEAMALPSRK